MSTDDAYQALAETTVDGDTHWAYGTGFHDAVSVSDDTVPTGADRGDVAAYALLLADDALILAQRLIEWCTAAPELEEEVALANIALDLVGQARLLYGHAGAVEQAGRNEDTLAYQRGATEFGNVTFVERANPDFAVLVARLLVAGSWRLAVMSRLTESSDGVLAAIAATAVPELRYHREYAAGWVVRLGDGTDLSHQRMAAAWADVLADAAELAAGHPVEVRLAAAGAAVDPAAVAAELSGILSAVGAEATLPVAQGFAVSTPSGRLGRHTSEFAGLLHTLQAVTRAHPGATW